MTLTHESVIYAAKQHLQSEYNFIVQNYLEIKGGLTNKLYRLLLNDGRSLVLKHYYHDNHQRLRREFDALSYLQTLGFTKIPTPYYKDERLNYAIYSFVQGETLPFRHEQTQGVTRDYLDQIVTFMVFLHKIEHTSENSHFLKAVGACFGIKDYVDMIEINLRKAENLLPNAIPTKNDGSLVIPQAVATIRSNLASVMKSSGKVTTNKLKGANLRLSPVDFGSHNTLISNKRVTFVDFEEFGWDDPMQMVAYATPALAQSDGDYLINKYLGSSPLPEHVTERLPTIVKLRELSWISRLLLGFTPTVIQKRQFAVTEFKFDEYTTLQCDRVNYHLKRLR